MRKIKRNTQLKNMPCYIQKMLKIAQVLGIHIDVFQTNSQNWIFHVNVDLEVLIQGEDHLIDTFENLIDM